MVSRRIAFPSMSGNGRLVFYRPRLLRLGEANLWLGCASVACVQRRVSLLVPGGFVSHVLGTLGGALGLRKRLPSLPRRRSVQFLSVVPGY